MSNNGTATPTVFDLDQVLAEKHARDPFQFRFAGEEWTLPSDVDIRAIQPMANGDFNTALSLLMGEEQWRRFERVGNFGVAALTELMNAYTKHADIDLAKLAASLDS